MKILTRVADAPHAFEPERVFVKLVLWAGCLTAPWMAILYFFDQNTEYLSVAGSALVVGLAAVYQLRTGRLRPGRLTVLIATLMAIQLPIFPESAEVTRAIPFGVAAIGAVGSPFIKKRWFIPYSVYMGAVYMSQLYWAPHGVRSNSILSLGFEVALFGVISTSLRWVANTSATTSLRYQNLFERVPTSIWQEDFTDVGQWLTDLRRRGVRDLAAHLESDPTLLDQAIALIRVTDVNPATIRMLNAEGRDQVLGHIDARTLTVDTRQSFAAQLVAVWEGHDAVTTEVLGTTIDGAPLEAVLHWTAPKDEFGRLALEQVVVAIIDVTDLKAVQRDLMAAKEAAELASITKSEFLANMSHEIRTPMNAILGMTELALVTELSAEQREYLGTTKTSVDALLNLVNDILDFSKIEAGKMELDRIPFGLPDTVGDTVRTLAVKAAEKGLELSHSVAPDVPDGVQGDPGRLRQVLINLIGNAIKFTHVGGVEVAVSLESEQEDAVHLQFSVSDSGIGIPDDQLQVIFDMFSQADGSSTRRYGGTGLGLTITTQLVEMMGGRVWVESEVGAGTTFHFTIELAPLGDATMLATPAGASSGRIPVLLISTDLAARRGLTEMLRQGGMHAIPADSEADALDLLDAYDDAPPVAVVDMASAFELPSRLIDLDLSVIVLADPGRRGEAVQYREVGVAGYLTKPVSHAELLEAIRITAAGSSGGNLITRHWLRENQKRYRVLLADDSPTNRMLAMRLLQNRGHDVVSVTDGSEAVEALATGEFDVILMDVQMPIMDGFEATAKIRQIEQGGDAHIPIVALTAHALDGDRDRCLQAGMDAYVSKPFRSAELFATIEQLVEAIDTPRHIAPAELGTTPEDTSPIDRREALELVGGMPEIISEIAALVLGEVATLSEEIGRAVEADDIPTVVRHAHRLKGSVGSIAATPSYRAALDLEEAARAEDAASIRLAWDELNQQLKLLQPELEALAREGVQAWN